MVDASVLPGREVRLADGSGTSNTTAEFDPRQPVMDRDPGLLRNFELNRSPSLFLNHGATMPHPAAGAYVVDSQADEIAASELAVDREVEQGKISFPALQLKPNPDSRDIFRLERALLADQAALVPGSPRARNGQWIAVRMVASSIPTAPSQRAPTTAANPCIPR